MNLNQECDRFIEAMKSIRQEIMDIEHQKISLEQSPLHNAPHVHEWLLQDEWSFVYSKKQAFFPLGDQQHHNKFWVPIARVDNPYGDKNLLFSLDETVS